MALWIRTQPEWIEIRPPQHNATPRAIEGNLDAGEEAAIRLALLEPGSLLLIDKSTGRSVADRLGVPNTGTLGVLLEASASGLIDLRTSLRKLRRTNFRVSQSLIDKLIS